MNNFQPMSFAWNPQAAEAAAKSGGASGINETGAYVGTVTSAVYAFGENSQSQTLVVNFESNGAKANFIRINFVGRDGQQIFGYRHICAMMWAAGVREMRPQQRQNDKGEVEWFLPDLEGKTVGLFLQKVLYTKQSGENAGQDSYRFEVMAAFHPQTRQTYRERCESEEKKIHVPAADIDRLVATVKDKDERTKEQPQGGNSWGGATNTGGNSGGWGQPQHDPNAVPTSRLQTANRQQQPNNPDDPYGDGIPF